MQTIKETVQAICNILQVFGINNIDPNVFRQAKHNLSEALLLNQSQILCTTYSSQIYLILNINQMRQQIIIQILMDQRLFYLFQEIHLLQFIKMENLEWIIHQEEIYYQQLDKYWLNQTFSIKYKKLIEKKMANLKINLVNKQKEQEGEIPGLKFVSKGNQIKNFENLNRIIKHQFKQLSCLLKRKDAQQSQIIQFLEFETSMHRHQKIFWAWLESTVDEDKKDVRDHADYGFPDETIIFSQGQQMIKLIQQNQLQLSNYQHLNKTLKIKRLISII